MNTWFSCRISYLKQADNGSIFKKNETYLLNALSFTEAEARLQGILEEYIPEYNLLACAKTNVTDVIIDESKEFFFKLRVTFVSADEDSGKEKKISENYLVQAANLKESLEIMEERLKGSIVQWEIPNISKAVIVDVFPYIEEAIVTKTKAKSKVTADADEQDADLDNEDED
jgi:hypothetical protein